MLNGMPGLRMTEGQKMPEMNAEKRMASTNYENIIASAYESACQALKDGADLAATVNKLRRTCRYAWDDYCEAVPLGEQWRHRVTK